MPFKRLETVFCSANKNGQRPERSYQKPQKRMYLAEACEDTCSWVLIQEQQEACKSHTSKTKYYLPAKRSAACVLYNVFINHLNCS